MSGRYSSSATGIGADETDGHEATARRLHPGQLAARTGSRPLAMGALAEINRRRLKAELHDCRRVTLDIDVTVIEVHKKEVKWTYI